MVMPAPMHCRRKRHAAQQPRLFIEAAAEEFVGGIDVQFAVDRQEDRRDEDEGEGRPEIILHKTKAILITLAGRREECDGLACVAMTLRPITTQRIAGAFEISVQIAAAAHAPNSVDGDADMLPSSTI